ncbi:tetratricopeptide repeat protein [Magnetofaba australis]|uniref:Putative tetratricopeptide repeat protein n=1 Tax=Magnetofaba australis IT-1 TaxID=1434232 RepID=A0A1Y2K1N4_9PROT|nr:tetratricopeptide repeat protein [Magnetofaba australis]OSM01882.1 putative tetratricopeptide repeat protein [Magnetofaba australis IT-1]
MDAQHLLQQAIAQQSAGQLDAALTLYDQLLQQQPEHADARYLAALAHIGQERHDAALPHLEQALSLRPQWIEARLSLGETLQHLGRSAEALEHYRDVCQQQPDNAIAQHRQGEAFMDLGENAAAANAFHRATQIDPNQAASWINLGLCLKSLKQFNEAASAFVRAINLEPRNPRAHVDFALTLLTVGLYEKGWLHYMWRFSFAQIAHSFARLPKSAQRWEGEDLHGKRIVVSCEQGYGDNIQFVRYLPMLKARNPAALALECPLPLLPLLQHSELEVDLYTIPSAVAQMCDGYDYAVPLLELPRLFETRVESIPGQCGYLTPVAESRQRWAERIDRDAFNIGVIWSGKGLHSNDPARWRSCELSDMAPWAELPTDGVRWHSLQTGVAHTEPPGIPGGPAFTDWAPLLSDFQETASAMLRMDLVISIDTAAAHLAGALEIPTWLLTPFAPDWRWGIDAADNPWYPTMRLFRQQAPGDWSAPAQEIRDALAQWLTQARPNGG